MICTSAVPGTWFCHCESSDNIFSSSTVRLTGLGLGQLRNEAQWHQSLPVISVLRPFSSDNTLLLEKEISQIVALEILASNFLHSSVQPKPKFHKHRLWAWNGNGTVRVVRKVRSSKVRKNSYFTPYFPLSLN